MSESEAAEPLEEFERWNDLPEELKLECMKYICFKTQCSMRATSRTEQRLVDGMRKVVEYLFIEKRGLLLRESSSGIRATNFHVRVENIPRREIDDRILPPLAHVLSTYHIKQISFEHCGLLNGRALYKLGELISPRTFRFDRLDACRGFIGQGFDVAMFCLKNSFNEVFDMAVSFKNNKKAFDELCSYIPKIKRRICLSKMRDEYIIPTFEKFAQVELYLGVELNVWTVSASTTIRNLADHFANQTVFVSFENNILRIKTSNPAKHILISSPSENWFCGVAILSNMETSRS